MKLLCKKSPKASTCVCVCVCVWVRVCVCVWERERENKKYKNIDRDREREIEREGERVKERQHCRDRDREWVGGGGGGGVLLGPSEVIIPKLNGGALLYQAKRILSEQPFSRNASHATLSLVTHTLIFHGIVKRADLANYWFPQKFLQWLLKGMYM